MHHPRHRSPVENSMHYASGDILVTLGHDVKHWPPKGVLMRPLLELKCSADAREIVAEMNLHTSVASMQFCSRAHVVLSHKEIDYIDASNNKTKTIDRSGFLLIF